MLGFEKLRLQGVPANRLVLGDETEEQLGNLAGNSTSLTVASAAMLAVIVSPQLREEMSSDSKSDPQDVISNGSHSTATILEYLNQHAAMDFNVATADGELDWTHTNPSGPPVREGGDKLCDSLLTELAKLAPLAAESAYGYHAQGTNKSESGDGKSGMVGSFEGKLREILPTPLYLTRESVSMIADVDKDHYRVRGLDLFDFSLHSIKRESKKWSLIYYAKDRNSGGAAIAEIRISLGEIRRGKATEPEKLGLTMEITSFMPARVKPYTYGKLPACCRTTILYDDENRDSAVKQKQNTWLVRMAPVSSTIQLSGEGETPSHRIDVGVMGKTPGKPMKQYPTVSIEHEKNFQEALERGEERRWLYANNWQHWPKSIKIRTPHPGVDKRVKGLYKRVECDQPTSRLCGSKNPVSCLVVVQTRNPVSTLC